MADRHRTDTHPAIGEQFGRWTVLGIAADQYRSDGRVRHHVHVRCQCGQEREHSVNTLRTGGSQSCGCLHRDIIRGPKPWRQSIVGERYGLLVVLAEAPDRRAQNGAYTRHVRVRCDCGTVLEVAVGHVRSGHTASCGASIHMPNRKHGLTGSPTYRAWSGMQTRCAGIAKLTYARNYRDRGITVSQRWIGPGGFERFLADMGECPPGMSIDRIDNDGNYEPGNCRWTTRAEQNRNRRDNVWIDFDDGRLVLADACRTVGLAACSVSDMVRKLGITHRAAFEARHYARLRALWRRVKLVRPGTHWQDAARSITRTAEP